MATKKSKSSKKSSSNSKDKSTNKSAAKPVEKTELEAPKNNEEVSTNELDDTKKISDEKTEDKESTKNSKETINEKTEDKEEKKGSCFAGFFAKKYDESESVLTVFKRPKFYGALLGEVIGTMFVSLLLFSLSLMGIANIAMYAFAVVAVLIAVYAFSGACLNPIVTVGMMATRRISVIRGVMYIIAEIVGAWLGWLIFNAFHLAGGDSAASYEIAMSEIAEGGFWLVALIELLGAAIIAFCFARALKYKKSVFTFAATVTGGIALAVLVGYVISAAFLGLTNNFIMNPAVALMMQIFPSSGEFGEVFGGVLQALSAYALIPAIGGIIGFYISDFTAKLSGEKLAE